MPKQTGMLWSEEPELRTGPVARAAMLAPVEKQYTFTVPDHLAEQVAPGKRLLVPFGKRDRPTPAFCVATAIQPWTSTLKPLVDVIDEERLLDDQLLELGQWMARYYCCPLGRTLAAMIPEPIRRQSGFKIVRVYRLEEGADLESSSVQRSAQRKAVVHALADQPEGIELEALVVASGASKGVIAAMVKAGLLAMETHRKPAPPPDFDRPGIEPTFTVNAEQAAAIGRINELTRAGAFRTVLLFGVSGSGKTEVYIRTIRDVLARGRQAILLVPEIALTTQIVERLASRFTDVALIHSGLTGVQRSLTWSAIARGLKRIVIGTRSAVFAPCADLGLIVVDEEQESSYKNLQSPRFHTREVAIKRAQLAGIPVVLGSATPSLETWNNCDRLSHFERLALTARVGGLPMPAVEFVDMRFAQKLRKGPQLLSPRMEEQIRKTLDAGQQVVLLLNRRGYASYLVCSRCRHVIVCPRCRANMVFHQTTGKALCHHCQSSMVVPARCTDTTCAGTLTRWGMGTQRVEEELATRFPQARLARADSDSMTHLGHYEKLIADFAGRKIDIIIGTQMIAKGLDFPAVAFVGVVNADTALGIPDFRAAERTFQLVTQVAGRAGRAEAGGCVVVQSFIGPTPALQYAMRHDYEAFARHELQIRGSLGWPPFTRLARLIVSHRAEQQARTEADHLVGAIRQYMEERGIKGEVLGPQTAPLARLRNLYRYDLLIRAPNANELMTLMDRLRHEEVIPFSARHIIIDVDPVSLL